MRELWKDWLKRPVRWIKLGHRPARHEPKHRPLAVERIEDRLMLSAMGFSGGEGGFISFDPWGSNPIGGGYDWNDGSIAPPSTSHKPPADVTTGPSDSVPVRHPKLAPIGSEELAAAPSEGGMIDLTRALRDTLLDESNRPLLLQSGMESIAGVSVEADAAIVFTSLHADVEPEFIFAAIPQTARTEDTLPAQPSPVSFSMPTVERIDGSRGRSRAFDLAIGFPAATARDENLSATEQFTANDSNRDVLVGLPDSVKEEVEAIRSEEQDEKALDENLSATEQFTANDVHRDVLVGSSDAVEDRAEAIPSEARNEKAQDENLSATEQFTANDLHRDGLAESPDSAENKAETIPSEARDEKARDEYFSAAEQFVSNDSYRDSLARSPDLAKDTAKANPSEERDEKASPARRKDDFALLCTQTARSKQEVEVDGAASADAVAAHHKAVYDQMAHTEGDFPLIGVLLDKTRRSSIAAVLTVVAAGHCLTTRQQQRSATHPRQMWLPRDRRSL